MGILSLLVRKVRRERGRKLGSMDIVRSNVVVVLSIGAAISRIRVCLPL